MRTHQILGIKFFGGTSREAVAEITRTGGLLVAPAAPSMINLCRDEDYRQALLAADLAIADSGFMVLLWKLFTGEGVPRISGLEHVKRLLEHESVRQPGSVLWVIATEASRDKLLEFLSGERVRPRVPVTAPTRHELHPAPDFAPPLSDVSMSVVSVSKPKIYIAPKYGRPVQDETLLGLVRQIRPQHIVIAVGGGVQDKLGLYLI